nr:hypothetical protein [Tanacetum cinerariifolium]
MKPPVMKHTTHIANRCFRSKVVTGLPEEFQEGDMVDALSRDLEQTSSEKWVDSGSGRRDYTLFGASLFAFLNPGSEAGNTKSTLFIETFGNNSIDESKTSGSETPAKEVVDNGNGYALIFLFGYDTGSKVVTDLLEEFQEGDMVDALSRVLEQTSLEKWVNSEAGNTKSTLFADTFSNSGVDESKPSGLETRAKEVVDNGNGSALIFLVGSDTGSKVVTGLPKEFHEGDMVDALSRVLEQTCSEKWVDSDSGSGRREYTLFGASLFAYLNPGSGCFARKRIWDSRINISSRQHLESKVVVKEWGTIHRQLGNDTPTIRILL